MGGTGRLTVCVCALAVGIMAPARMAFAQG